MAKEIDGTLYLNAEESRSLLHNWLHPDEEAMRRRDAFFAECDKLEIEHKDGCVVLHSFEIDDEAILRALGT